MRSKEEAHDYRYFPDPDLVPVTLSEEFLNGIRKSLPELPDKKKHRFVADLKLTEYDAGVLVAEAALATYFEDSVKAAGPDTAKPVCNWITNELLGRLNAVNKTITESPVSPKQLAGLLALVQKGTISGKVAKDVFTEMFDNGGEAEAIAEMPKAVAEYKAGKETAIGSLVGLIMKKSKGKANPQLTRQFLAQKLS